MAHVVTLTPLLTARAKALLIKRRLAEPAPEATPEQRAEAESIVRSKGSRHANAFLERCYTEHRALHPVPSLNDILVEAIERGLNAIDAEK